MSIKQIFFLVYEGFELLDMSGPAAVFSTTNQLTAREDYKCRFVSVTGNAITCCCGLPVITEKAGPDMVGKHDTVLVMGGEEEPLLRASQDNELLQFIRKVSKRAERTGSVCTGTFLLAASGILSERSATTHWIAADQLSGLFPDISVLPDVMYHVDKNIWTSAGVTTGIDMALAMVEKDLGHHIMDQVARRLVVYSHRPGHQSQFSHVLNAQMASARQFTNIIDWIEENLQNPIKVEDMANRAGMSERTFYRKFTEAIGTTPSKYLEHTRLERAKQLIASGEAINIVANAIGFKSQAGFRTAFENKYGVSPSLYRKMNYKS